MAQRLVQLSDLQRYPFLHTQGVSVNQLYDFTLLEHSVSQPPNVSTGNYTHYDVIEEQSVVQPNEEPKPKAKKEPAKKK